MWKSNKKLEYSKEIIEELGLTALKGESGYISYITSSKIVVQQDGHDFKANSSIYYLLNRDRPINYLHWLAPDDTHVLLEGGPVHYYEFHEENGKYFSSHHLVGRDILKGEWPVLMIPGGNWKALVFPVDVEYALLTTILTPQWTDSKSRLKIGAGQEFIDNYKSTSPWAAEGFLREIIGPNFKE